MVTYLGIYQLFSKTLQPLILIKNIEKIKLVNQIFNTSIKTINEDNLM